MSIIKLSRNRVVKRNNLLIGVVVLSVVWAYSNNALGAQEEVLM